MCVCVCVCYVYIYIYIYILYYIYIYIYINIYVCMYTGSLGHAAEAAGGAGVLARSMIYACNYTSLYI